jgi:hypothetical protein
VQAGRKERIFHTANPFDPIFKQRSVEARIGEIVTTATEPSFTVEITHGKFHSYANGSPIPPGEFEIQISPPAGQEYMGVRRSGEPYELDMDGAHWSFVLSALDSARTRFRIDIYKDGTAPNLTGIDWTKDGSRLFVWETTRRGDALLTLTTTGRDWELRRSAMRLASGNPHTIMTVHNGLDLDPDGRTAIVESARTIYRCAVDEAVCRPIASRPPDRLDIRVPSGILPSKVLDWYCPAGS